MENIALKVIGIIILFLAMTQGAIIVFNKLNPWIGIGTEILAIAITYILLRALIKKNDNKSGNRA